MSIENIQKQLLNFSHENNLEQFHDPKRLIRELSDKVFELAEEYDFSASEENSAAVMSSSENEYIKENIADIVIYLIYIANKLDVDLNEVVENKIAKQEINLPDKEGGSLTLGKIKKLFDL